MADEKLNRAVEQLVGVDWSALGVLEHQDGTLLFPDKLSRRKKDGSLEEQPITIRVVSNPHRVKARVKAREWATRLKLDLDRDKDLVDELERMELLAFIVRDGKAPYDQHRATGEELFREYLLPELSAIWARHELLIDVVDPRFGKMNAEDVWQMIAAVAERGEPSPLAGMPGFEQGTCITLMAKAACSSPSAPSWLRLPSTSSSGSSPPTP